MMKLYEAVQKIEELDNSLKIFAVEPWGSESDAILSENTDEQMEIRDEAGRVYAYFLEVYILKDRMYGWAENIGYEPSLEEKLERIIHYAKYDA